MNNLKELFENAEFTKIKRAQHGWASRHVINETPCATEEVNESLVMVLTIKKEKIIILRYSTVTDHICCQDYVELTPAQLAKMGKIKCDYSRGVNGLCDYTEQLIKFYHDVK